MFRVLLTSCAAALLVAMATGQYQLSSGVEDLVPNVDESFSCEGRPFGYYADVANGCQIFHICVPAADETGQAGQFSFLCANQTIFDQATLTCNYPVDALPCEDAESQYAVKNDEFFRIASDNEA